MRINNNHVLFILTKTHFMLGLEKEYSFYKRIPHVHYHVKPTKNCYKKITEIVKRK